MAIPLVPYTMVNVTALGNIRDPYLKRSLTFFTWSNLTLVLLWVVIIFLIYYTKNMSREVHIAQRGAITPLIKMLQSSDEQVVEMSAFALGLADNEENLADFIKAGNIQRLQDDNFTVQPIRDCVVRTLKRLETRFMGLY
ncbi:BnaA07g08900D [Brassica napus]|uniref:BnaA07g08900D protein n=1 Tax=Brassica napus TaxID=3708 RepID=A0A078FS43_BRANA|nr:BnaA07g08900D [Brassica napus]